MPWKNKSKDTIDKINLNKFTVIFITFILIISAFIVVLPKTMSAPSWPSTWILYDEDPNEGGDSQDNRDVKNASYNTDFEYLYFRLECYGLPNFDNGTEARYKWFIDTDDPHNMGTSGGNVYEAEYLFFIEDSPKPGGDGIGDIYLIYDVDNDGLMSDDWPDYMNNPGPINDSLIADYSIQDHYIDLYINLNNLSNPSLLYFTWATDQENPNLDQAPHLDRSDTYWNLNISKADLSIVKTDEPDPVNTGGYLTYTIDVTNHGPNNAGNVNVSDTLPTGVTFNYANPAPTGNNSPTYWWIFSSIDVGNTETITINTTVDNDIIDSITNNVTVFNYTFDPYLFNNEDSEETNVNNPPVAADDYILVAEGGTATLLSNGDDSVLDNDTDDDGDSLTAIKISNPSHGSVTLDSDGTFSYTHDGSETTSDSFTYKANDGIADSNVATVHITITGVNDPPVALDDSYSVSEGETLNVAAPGVLNNDYDNESDPLTSVLDSGPSHASSFTLNSDGSFEYVHDGSETTSDSFTYHANDGTDDSNVATVAITINPVNDPPNNPSNPNPSNDAVDVNINTDLSWSCIDVDGDNITYVVYFEAYDSTPDEIVSNNQSESWYDPGSLDYVTPYYWLIVAWDNNSHSNLSNYWHFTTESSGGDTNHNPVADASAGEPYLGFVGEEIMFNGSLSYDPDGYIDSWHWDFDDGTEEFGETVTHIYFSNGTYQVTLKVTDNEGAIDKDVFDVIILKGNNPPSIPIIDGPTAGHKNNNYEFSAVSFDADNDTIQYIFDWGDGVITITDFLQNGMPTFQTHSWTNHGEYVISVTAYDNQTESETSNYTILIDVYPIDDEIKGYLIDEDSEDIYDVFNNTETKKQTHVIIENGTYLIDIDGDGRWDYAFNLESGLLRYHDYLYEKYYTMYKDTPGFELISLLAIIALLAIILRRRRK